MATPTKPIGPLDRQPNENVRQHRAFVLYAMQDANIRSLRLASRAIEQGVTTVQRWKVRANWNDRCDSVGPACQAIACRVYREVYLHKIGVREVNVVESKMSVPFLPDEPMPSEQGDGPGKRTRISDAASADSLQREARRHLGLIDAALRRIDKGLKDKSLKPRITDLPHLIKLRREIAANLDGVHHNVQAAVPDSARVTYAKTNGEDIVKAMHEDAVELQAILGAIVAKSEAGAEGEVIELAEKAG